MFDVICPTDSARVLIWSSQVTAARNADHGIELDFRCHCGARATALVVVSGPWKVVSHRKQQRVAA